MPEDIYGFEGEYRFLSNFYPAPVTFEHLIYPTSEHAYQAAKTTDFKERVRFTQNTSPGQAKREGKKLELRSDWNDVREDVMKRIVLEKFSNPNHSVLRARLLDTKDAVLVETNNWHDQFWGDCICGRPRCADAGVNKLGQILMQVRSILVGNREVATFPVSFEWGSPMIGVIGSRTFFNAPLMEEYLNRIREKYPKMWLVSGAQPKGADGIAEKWAKRRGVPILLFPPDWDGPLKKGAGMARNTLIVAYSHVIVAFWDGTSPGTRDSIVKALEIGRKVVVSTREGEPKLISILADLETHG